VPYIYARKGVVSPVPSLALTSSPEELRDAFSAMRNPRDIAALLDVPYAQLVYHIYKVSPAKKYSVFQIRKRSGGVRKISAPQTALKILQRKLNQVLQVVYLARGCVHGFVNKRSIVTNATAHLHQRYVLNIDLADFFPSINFGRVRGMFMARPYQLPDKVATVLAQICCHDNELPQGAPTSPVVANMICAKLDNELRRLAHSHSCRCAYTRYADDLSFSTPLSTFPADLAFMDSTEGPPQVRVGVRLREIIHGNGFAINPDKVRLADWRHRQEVTGLVVNRRANVPRSFVRQVRAMLHAWREYKLPAAEGEFLAKYDRRHRRPGGEPPSFKRVVKGKIEYLGMVRGKRDPIYRRCLAKYAELDPDFTLSEETGWDKVNRQLGEALARLSEATTVEQCQSVGHLCRETLISLAQTVFDPGRHGGAARPDVGAADAKEMLDAFVATELKGASAESLRKLSKATIGHASTLVHKRTASIREAEACHAATKVLVDHIGAITPETRSP
jgi:RNA-directed DNA polymerase